MSNDFSFCFDNDERIGKCPICGSSRFELKSHITNHDTLWSLSCPKCGYHINGFNSSYVFSNLRWDQLKVKFCKEQQ